MSCACSLLISVASLSRLCRAVARATVVALSRSEEVPAGAAGATHSRRGDQPAMAFLAPLPYDCQAKPAAKPTTKITRTRAKRNETSLPSHNHTPVIRFRAVRRSGGSLDRSVAGRPLENSDSVEVRLGFIGIPPSASNL